jgi:C4-dicarboxylate transporter, DctM subunit
MQAFIIPGSIGAAILLGAIGVPIAYAMGIAGIAAIALTSNVETALGLAGDTAFTSMREYLLVVIPLFDGMGFIVARSGAAEDLFAWVNRALRHIPGKFAVATVIGNAIFATVTGIAAVSAVTFSRIAYPQMRRYKYDARFAFGCVAGSSVLGLLLPPGILLIIWALITEQSVGRLFKGAIVPGIVLAAAYSLYCVGRAVLDPKAVPANGGMAGEVEPSDVDRRSARIGITGIAALMLIVLGGIWGGFFTPTEASAFGLAGAVALGLAKGMTVRQIVVTLLDSGKMTAPLLLLLIAAQIFSRMLAYQGVTDTIEDLLKATSFSAGGTFFIMILVWLVLGSMLDSISIMLLTAPIFWPIAKNLGFDQIGFTIAAILFIEAGLLHPPFGTAVYLVKASISEKGFTLADGFWGTLPFCFILLGVAVLVAVFPGVASWLAYAW